MFMFEGKNRQCFGSFTNRHLTILDQDIRYTYWRSPLAEPTSCQDMVM